jgi:hypothetical protein
VSPRFSCDDCPWVGDVPSWTDCTPLDLKPGEQRARQVMVPVCPRCLGTALHRERVPPTILCAGCHECPALPQSDLCEICERLFTEDWNERFRQQNQGERYALISAVLPAIEAQP